MSFARPTVAALIAVSVASAAEPRVDRFGDALPDGALMRLGTVALRTPGIVSVGLRPDGSLVALTQYLELHSWSADGKSMTGVTRLTEEKGTGYRCALSPDARLAAGPLHRGLVIWDISGAKPVELLARPVANADKLCFSANGKWFAFVDYPRDRRGVVTLCNLIDKKWHELSFTGNWTAQSVAFTPDGGSLVVASDHGVKVFDTATKVERFQAFWSSVPVKFAALSPDGGLLAILPAEVTPGPVPTVKLFSIATGKEVDGLKPPTASAHWLGFSADGKTLLLGTPHAIREWDFNAGKLVREIAGPAESPAVFSAAGRRLAAHGSSAILLWDMAYANYVRPELVDAGHVNGILGVAVSPDGKLIATDDSYGEVRVWSADTGRQLSRLKTARLGGCRSFAFLNDKSLVLIGEDRVTPVVHDAFTGKELRRFASPKNPARDRTCDLQLTSDGKTVLALGQGHSNAYVTRWDAATGRLTERSSVDMLGSLLEMGMFAVSPDGRWLAEFGTLYRLGTSERIKLLGPNESVLTTSRFSRDSRLVAFLRRPNRTAPGANPGSIIVYDLMVRQKLMELDTGTALPQAFSPDGRHLVVLARAEFVLWDLASRRAWRRLPASNSTGSLVVAFMPDGRRLVTGHADSTALVWDLAGAARPAAALAPADLDRLWLALTGEDGAKAYAAELELLDHSTQAVPLLRERLKPIRAADEDTVRKIVAQLGSATFAERESATKALRELGDAAVAHLRAALQAGLPAEAKTRVERLLAESDAAPVPAGARQRQVRGVMILERINNDDARKLLTKLAAGLPEARQTREASEALKRLGTK